MTSIIPIVVEKNNRIAKLEKALGDCAVERNSLRAENARLTALLDRVLHAVTADLPEGERTYESAVKAIEEVVS